MHASVWEVGSVLAVSVALGGCQREGLHDFLLGPSSQVTEPKAGTQPHAAAVGCAYASFVTFTNTGSRPSRLDHGTIRRPSRGSVWLFTFVECAASGSRIPVAQARRRRLSFAPQCHIPRDGSGAPTSPRTWPAGTLRIASW